MKEYRKSHYAINKMRKGIVYRNADGSVLEVTFEKIAENNPGFTVEDFEKLKQLSDELYHAEANNDYKYHYHVTSELDDDISSDWISTLPLEDEVLKQSDNDLCKEKLSNAIETLLTPIQRRRFKMFLFEGLTYREIAQKENADVKSVWESLELAKKKIKTTGLAGGLLCPYKGLLLAALASALNSLPTASFHHAAAKAAFLFA